MDGPSGTATASRLETAAENLVTWTEKFSDEISGASEDEIQAVLPYTVTALDHLVGVFKSYSGKI